MNDPFDSELDSARDAVSALAQHVDTSAAWNAVSAAVDRAPRVRARRRAELAAVLMTVVAVVVAAVYVRHSNPSTAPIATRPAHAPGGLANCALPSLPAPGSGDTPQSLDLSGPAVASLQGGAARTPFDLGNGELTLALPRPDDTPSVSAEQAECAALATSNSNGSSLLQFATATGAAVGYGRVTVSPQLVAAAKGPTYLEGQTNRNTHATLPKATPYQDRLAWLVVVRDVEIYHGPPGGIGKSASTTAPAGPPTYDYDVFLVDAHTGTDALLYTEAQAPDTSGAVSIPVERISVPWALKSRSPNGYSGEVTATVLACDGLPNPVSVDRGRAALAVVVERPFDPHCGATKEVTLELDAAVVTFNLPADIAHDSLGPAVESPDASARGYSARCPATQSNGRTVIECYYEGPGSTGGVFRVLSEADSGSTLQITVGSVLSVGPLHNARQYAALPVTSSDPSALGSLFPDNEVHEFRAWHAGHVDLFVPTSACSAADAKGGACTPPWIVHVNIE